MCRSMVDIQSATAEIRRGEKRKKERTRMWANAQRDGRSAEHRWFSAAVRLTPTTRCRAVTLPRPVEICRGAPNSLMDLSR